MKYKFVKLQVFRPCTFFFARADKDGGNVGGLTNM